MTDKYQSYVAMLATRDSVLTTLAMLAIGSVLAWEVIRTLPKPWQRRTQIIVLIVGALAYLICFVALFYFREVV